MAPVMDLCLRQLESSIRMENAIKNFVLAEKYSVPDLKDKATKLFWSNVKELKEADDYRALDSNFKLALLENVADLKSNDTDMI